MDNAKKKTTKKKGLATSYVRVPNFHKFYVTNVRGGLTSHDFRFELMNEKLFSENNKEVTFIVDAVVILSPVGAKRFFNQLKDSISEYEKENGPIPDEIETEKIIC